MRNGILSKSEHAAVKAMTPEEVIEWCCDGPGPYAVLMVDMQGEEFWKPMLNGVAVGDRFATHLEAQCHAAEQLAKWLRAAVEKAQPGGPNA